LSKGWFFMSGRSLVLSLLFILPVGCTQFQTGRTYLSEMENDDSTFFNPKEDFPIVAGDTGRYWTSEKERRARTPASEDDLMEDRTTRALRAELKSLEAGQSEEGLEFYEKHKHQLTTPSEKIYFLKLANAERREYLMTRGFIAEPSANSYTPREKLFAVRKQDILLGMKKTDVMESWGKPLRVEVAGNPRNENERWLYKMNGASKYIYFESGEVQGWE
jgi:hypothetical protein